MISAGVETANIKIPVIVGHHEHIRFDVLALSPQEPAQQTLVRRDAGFVEQRPLVADLGQALPPADEEGRELDARDPVQVLGREGTALVDGTICPVWDWDAIPDLHDIVEAVGVELAELVTRLVPAVV